MVGLEIEAVAVEARQIAVDHSAEVIILFSNEYYHHYSFSYLNACITT